MCGYEAAANREFLELSYPVEHGVVSNWADMQVLWDYTFRKLNVDPHESWVLLTEVCENYFYTVTFFFLPFFLGATESSAQSN